MWFCLCPCLSFDHLPTFSYPMDNRLQETPVVWPQRLTRKSTIWSCCFFIICWLATSFATIRHHGSNEFAKMKRWISSSEELKCRCNMDQMCVCECPSTSHRYHVESKTWLLSTHAKSFKWHVRTSWNLQNWKSAKSHSKTQKQRKLLRRYTFIGQLNTFQRKWSRNSLCFDHMNSSMKMQQTISKVPFGKTSPLPKWPLPTSCCNSLRDANWRCWIPHGIGMHRFQTFSWVNSQSKEMLQRISNAFPIGVPSSWPVLSDTMPLRHHNWDHNAPEFFASQVSAISDYALEVQTTSNLQESDTPQLIQWWNASLCLASVCSLFWFKYLSGLPELHGVWTVNMQPSSTIPLDTTKALTSSNTRRSCMFFVMPKYGIRATLQACLRAEFSEQQTSMNAISWPTLAETPVSKISRRLFKSPTGTSCCVNPRVVRCFTKSLVLRHFVNMSAQLSVPGLYLRASSSDSILLRIQCRRISMCRDFLGTSLPAISVSALSESDSITTYPVVSLVHSSRPA